MAMKKPTDRIRALLQRHISGEANASDEKTLGALAEGDPFVQDALEGFEALPDGKHDQRLARLKTRLRQRTRQRALVVLSAPLRRIAAVLVVGLMTGALWWFFQLHTPMTSEHSLAVQDAPAPAPEVAAAEDSAAQPLAEEAPAVPAPSPAELPQNRKPLAARPQRAAPQAAAPQNSAQPEIPPPPVATRSSSPDPSEGPSPSAAPAREAASPAPSAPAKSEPATRSHAAAALSIAESAKPQASNASLIISGKVTTAAGEPLVGASIQLAGTPQGAVTNQEGRYELAVPAHANPARLVVSYTGYAAQTVLAAPGSQVNIVLSESGLVLNEVSVAGRQKRKPLAAGGAAWVTPQPRGGFSALEAHIARHKQAPKQAEAVPEDAASLSVELLFSVLPNGRLEGFIELNSPGAKWTREAIRLLRTGPRWENKTGRRQTARYTVVF